MEILTIQFQNNLTFEEIPLFRGAVLHLLADDESLLLHNHVSSGFRYAYPLVQYKSFYGKAAVVCLNEGIDTMMQLMKKSNLQVRIGKKNRQPLLVEQINPQKFNISVASSFFQYHITRWLPLNSENYGRFLGLKRLVDRILFLEQILTANILSFLKGVDVYMEEPVECHLLDVDDKSIITTNKGIKVMAFDASFQTNVKLPEGIGLGKHASLGYGIIIQEKHIN